MTTMTVVVVTLAAMSGVVVIGGLIAMNLSHKRKQSQNGRVYN